MSQRNYYEILGVSKDSDAESIKKAYRKLAMQYHPDRNPGDKAAEDKFKEAAAAYEVLSNSEKKAQYDRFGHEAFTQSGGGARGGGAQFTDMEDIFSHFGDIFGDIFGGGGRSRSRDPKAPRRGADLRYITEVSLKEVISGVERDVEFDTEEGCDDCGGSGAEKGTSPQTCGTCRGTGQVVRSQGFFQMASPCSTCHGEGVIIKSPCKSCRGKGRKSKHRKIRVNIPPGVDTGTRLRVSGEGEGGHRGGSSGDLYVEVRVKEDRRFERQGDHLLSAVEIPYTLMILGGSVEVETVTGSASLEIPRGAQPGDALKLSGQGLPSLRGSRRGDIHYSIEVKIPKKPSKEEERLLRELAKVRGDSVREEKKGFFS